MYFSDNRKPKKDCYIAIDLPILMEPHEIYIQTEKYYIRQMNVGYVRLPIQNAKIALYFIQRKTIICTICLQ